MGGVTAPVGSFGALRCGDRIATLVELGDRRPVLRRPALEPLSIVLLSLLALLACGDADSERSAAALSASSSVSVAGADSISDGHEAAQAISFVGSESCIGCHPQQGATWRGSHHDRAMELATAESVIGRFDGSMLRGADGVWRFFREENLFFVELESPGQATERLSVRYTFGVDPLQQYLVARSRGRMQALPVAWDDRPRDLGGQRWIDLQPDGAIGREDPLHWEAIAYNWNSQCAACHSTQFDKGYDVDADRFDSGWAEIDVGCEACHGPGSAHAAGGKLPAPLPVAFEPWSEADWRLAPGARIASRVAPRRRDAQLDVCGPCHARRSPIVASPSIGSPLLDGYQPRLLDPELYFEDGQIRDEVYVWGSFLQSRMHAAGVRCGDCHDPHSLELRRPSDALCLGCHSGEAYATRAHHGHTPNSVGANCVDCHMPERVYMKVDGRRDHTFPVPRPRQKAILEAPDVCQGCHPGRDANWSETQISKWSRSASASDSPSTRASSIPSSSSPSSPSTGNSPSDAVASTHWSAHLIKDSALRTDPERWIEIAVDGNAPPIARASAWSRLAREAGGRPPTTLVDERLREGSALERLALVDVVRLLPPQTQVALLRPLLEDPVRSIRIVTAAALVELPASVFRPADRSVLAAALVEYRAAQDANAERPEAQVNLGLLALRYGDLEAASEAYTRALERAPYFIPAYANMADLERARGRDAEAIDWLRQALVRAPDDGLIRYALGLALHRIGEPEQALSELARAARDAPEQPRLVLGWALALDAAGRRSEAIRSLGEAIDRGLTEAELFHALVTLQRDAGNTEEALRRAHAWRAAWPDDARASGLIRALGGRP